MQIKHSTSIQHFTTASDPAEALTGHGSPACSYMEQLQLMGEDRLLKVGEGDGTGHVHPLTSLSVVPELNQGF